MHNINNTNNAQFDDKNPPASPKGSGDFNIIAVT